jgi:hypothetical protein
VVLSGILFINRANTADAGYGAIGGTMIDGSVILAATQRATIINNINAAGGQAVSFNTATMIADGAIDPSITPTTPTGGTWCLEFREYVTGAGPTAVTHIQGIVGSAGETNPKKPGDAAVTAAATGRAFAGFVTAGVATGANWTQALSAFTGPNTCNFGPNAFVALISDNQAIGTTNWLARVAIPGNQSANDMTVPLGMGGNDINAANNINAKRTSLTGTPATADGQAAVLDVVTQTIEASGPASVGPLTVNGNGTATGTFTVQSIIHTSDGRKKYGWERPTDCVQSIRSIKYGRFRWIDGGRTDDGVEAQSLIPLFPELVHTDPRGVLGVNYDGLFPVTLCGISEATDAAAAADARANEAMASARSAAKIAHHALEEVRALRRRIATPGTRQHRRAA